MIVAVAALVLAARLLLLPLIPPPTPVIADEYSHLLLAHTLASGRMANPPHPLWRHFDTLFVLQQPTYASVYPPLQGMILALGLLLGGDPWVGVLLSVAAMCAATVWMLRAYVTPFWAVYGGLLAGAAYGVISYWANSYWGGAGAALGGALVFGALPRMAATIRARHALILAVGLFLLANSRPYEGFLISLPVACWFVWHLGRANTDRAARLRSHALPLGAVLAAGALFICWYNWRVTRSPFRLPYTSYIEQRAAAPAFIWQGPRSVPEYGDRVLREAHLTFDIDYAAYSTVPGLLHKTYNKIAKLTTFYFGPFWVLVLVLLPDIFKTRKLTVLLAAICLCVAGILLTVGFQVHYAAPCASAFILLLVEAFRAFRRWSRPVGGLLILAAPGVLLALQAVRMNAAHFGSSLEQRPAVAAKLASQPGRHVVFVRYAAGHPLGEEWVYNDPDIDGSGVIWARDLGPGKNRDLIEHYPGRTFWVLQPDGPQIRLTRLR